MPKTPKLPITRGRSRTPSPFEVPDRAESPRAESPVEKLKPKNKARNFVIEAFQYAIFETLKPRITYLVSDTTNEVKKSELWR